MDEINGGPSYSPFGGALAGLPIGFGMALTMNEESMNSFAALTEAEKEKIILRARDAKSKKEMDDIVSSLVPPQEEGEVRKLIQQSEERDSFK